MNRTTLQLLCALVAGLAWPAAAEVNTLSALEVKATASGAQVVATGTRPATFSVFRLNDPDRLVVDLNGADVASVRGHHDGSGPVSGVVASQFSDEQASVGRLLVALDKASKYDVRADGNRVVISVDSAVAGKEAPSEVKEMRVASAPSANAVALTAAEAPKSDVQASRIDEQNVANPATKVTGLKYSRNVLSVVGNGGFSKFELTELNEPPRLVVDVYGVKASAKAPKVHGGLLSAVRVGTHEDKVRLVMDMAGAMPTYVARRTANGVDISLNKAVSSEPVTASAKEQGSIEIDGRTVAMEPGAEPLKVAQVEVQDIKFEENVTGGRVELKLSGETQWKVDRPDGKSAVLTLENAKLPRRLERSLDTSDLGTPVKMISAFGTGEAKKVKIVVASAELLDETLVKSPQGMSWRLSAKGMKPESATSGVKAAGFATEGARYAEQGAPQRTQYVGKKVSFEFKDIDIHNLLRVIAEVSKKNIVVADDVSGKITIRLRNVPWDQALDLILRSKSLGKEDLGSVMRVAPLKSLEEEAKLREERKKSERRQEELVVQLVPVNYAVADQMKDRVKEILSERGNITVDTRTNTLIVRDVGSNMTKLKSLVSSLDTQTPQVLIESRIVEANTSFARQVGIQWGGMGMATTATGNPTGLAFPNQVVVRGGSSQSAPAGAPAPPNWAVSLPAAAGEGAGGALGMIFGSAGGALQLNLRLSAMENQGVVKTISAPKVTTLDNNTAKISQGVSIPFSQQSAQGVNTQFIEARLSLEVTPHITQDGSILMNIRAENNQPDRGTLGANGQPSITRKEATTQVLVKDSDTTVIGGIYVRGGGVSTASVPVLSKIPLLGFFFRNHVEQESRQELLIFITPRILNRQNLPQSL